MFNASIIRQWWPQSEAEKASREEPARFQTTINALRDCWESNADHDESQKCSEMRQWCSIVDRLAHSRFRTDIPEEDVNAGLLLLLDIVTQLTTSQGTYLLGRYAGILAAYLQNYKRQITVTLPWRPLYLALSKYLECKLPPGYSGSLTATDEVGNLLSCLQRMRRFFPRGSATEIWEEVRMLMGRTHQLDAIIGVGWLRILLPTRELLTLDPQNGSQWNSWAQEWMEVWDSIIHLEFWESSWLLVFERLAKHDRHGVIDWQPLLARLYTHILWSFHVPIGSASLASPPFGKLPIHRATTFFGELRGKRLSAAGGLCIWLLHRCPSNSPDESDPALLSLERLGQLLEQYYHPSNNGRWTKPLSNFLRSLAQHLGSWTQVQHAKAVGLSADESDMSDDEPTEVDSNMDAEMPSFQSELPNTTLETQKRVAHVILKLSAKAQFSKDESLATAACDALARTTTWIPDVSIPLIINHFQMALDTVTAHQQLVSAIKALTLAMRAILLVGFKQADESDLMDTDTSPRVLAAQAVSLAMNATLPGIDANDEEKTSAVFRMYATILSTIGDLEETPNRFPLFVEEWLEEFLSRIFAILINVDPLQTRADVSTEDHEGARETSFLLSMDCMFKPVITLLIARLPDSLKTWTVKHVARFVETTFLSTTEELAHICRELCRCAPQESVQYIVEPLMIKLETEHLHPIALENGNGHRPQLSKVRTASIVWHVSLLEECFSILGRHTLPLKTRLLNCLDQLFGLFSLKVTMLSMDLLESTLRGLLDAYLLEGCSTAPYMSGTEEQGTPMEQWINIRQCAMEGSVKALAPQWHKPTPEEVELGEELVRRYLLLPSRKLSEMCKAGGSEPPKEELVNLLLQIEGVLTIAASSIPDLAHPGTPLPGTPLTTQAQNMAAVGSANSRQEAVEALLLAAKRNFSDPGVQKHLMYALKQVFPHEPLSNQSSRRDAVRHDLSALHDLPEFSSLTGEGGKWRKRCPRWLTSQTASIYLAERVAESMKTQQLTDKYPIIPASSVPPVIKDITVEVVRYGLQPHQEITSVAISVLSTILKRYPCLIAYLIPTLLAGLAGTPMPPWPEVRASMDQDTGSRIVSAEQLSQLAHRLDASSEDSAPSQLSAAEMRAEESRVHGAFTMLWMCDPFAMLSLDSSAMIGVMLSQLAGLLHKNPKSIDVTYSSLAMYTVKFQTPAYLHDKKAMEDSDMRLYLDALLEHGSGESSTHWKLKAASNICLIMLLPPRTAQETQRLTRHFFGLLHNQLSILRNIAALFFIRVLGEPGQGLEEGCLETASNVVAAALEERPAWGAEFLDLLSHSHPGRPASQAESMNASVKEKTRDTMLVQCLSAALQRQISWPDARSAPSAVADRSITMINVRLIKALAELAPKSLLATMQGPLNRDLGGTPQQEKRTVTLTAIETIAALVSSGIVFSAHGSEASAWDEWVNPLLTHALAAAPLEYGEAWACALRFCLHSVAPNSIAGLNHILHLVLQPITSDGETQPIVKKLKAIGHIAAELSVLDVIGCEPYDPAKEPLKAAGQAFMCQVLRELPKLAESSGDMIRRHVASTAVVVLAAVLRKPSSDATPDDNASKSDPSEVKLAMQDFLDFLLLSMKEGVAFIAKHERTNVRERQNGVGEPDGLSGLLKEPCIARLGTSMQVIQQSLRGGERMCAVQMQPTLVKMLPFLLRCQEIAAPELTSLAMEAKSILSLFKYLPIPAADVESVIETLVDTSKEERWWCRAAALVFLQYFWFRHNFLMSSQQEDACREMVLRLLHDRKLEIGETAANTLSGMLKGMSQEAFQKLKDSLMGQLEQLVPRRAKGSKLATTTDGQDVQAQNHSIHAVVLGLKAFVLSTPYDVPPWLPDVLMALSRVSSRPNPIKAAVRKTISEFKRTHEEAGMMDFKRMLTEDQWETLQGVAMPASYFA